MHPPFISRGLARRNVYWRMVCNQIYVSRARTRDVSYGMVASNQDVRAPATLHASVGCVGPAFSDLSFRSIGLDNDLVNALQRSFRDMKCPTVVQERLIKEILQVGGRDILLRDDIGSGKSFGIVLGLLGKPRSILEEKAQDGQTVLKRVITSLFIVPHRDLAYQILRWIEQIIVQLKPQLKLEVIAQLLVRGSRKTTETSVEEIKATPPHILICTPQAFLEAYKMDKEALRLETLSTVVVDEVDYLVPTVAKDPKKSYWKAYEKEVRKVRKHPGPTREILDIVYAKRKALREKSYARDEDMEQVEAEGIPQLVLSSATLRAHLKDYLFYESGWLNGVNLVKITGPAEKQRTGNGNIGHSILVVSDAGAKNVEGAIEGPSTEERGSFREAEEEAEEEAAEAGIDEYYDEKYETTPSPFNPISLEVVATAFASDVPMAALLVVPSSAPVKRAVYELRTMGVNAHGLDLFVEQHRRRANPTLLVATVATTRGLDLPSLTHVFVLGLLEGQGITARAVDSYMHVSGRVGRFGRPGKAISVVEEAEAPKVSRILSTIGEKPVQFKQFI